MPTHVPVFIATTLLLAMLPGASQAMMIRQVLGGGQRTVRGTLAGNATGFLLWSTAAAAGLSTALLASPRAYAVLRIAGGIVLMILGVNTLRTALTTASTSPPREGGRRTGFAGGYLTGLSTNLGNPKAGVFAVSVLPQFVTPQGPVFLSTVALGALWALVSASWYLLLTWAVGRGRALISRPTVLRGLSVTTGVVLLGLGAAVAAGV
ncbi:LysE family translocator [Microtetraspora malaysiensis]|uniref:LysE family translocator n=1 Tax=Microtetraspora malaysiensis TaxID=161358 RepID=UPI00082CDB88|nr:LysE family translocator [Microtetraspora malaysiensis]